MMIAAVVLVELLADDPHGHLGLAVEQRRLDCRLGRVALDAPPTARAGDLHVGFDLLLGRRSRRRSARSRPCSAWAWPGRGSGGAACGCPCREAAWRCRTWSLFGTRTTNRPGRETSWVRRAPLCGDRVLGDLAEDVLSVLQASLRCLGVRRLLLLDVVLVVLRRRLGTARRSWASRCRRRRLPCPGRTFWTLTQVDVAVDLADVVGGPNET